MGNLLEDQVSLVVPLTADLTFGICVPSSSSSGYLFLISLFLEGFGSKLMVLPPFLIWSLPNH